MQRDCMFSDIVEYMLVLALTIAKPPNLQCIPSLIVLNSMPKQTTMPIASLMMQKKKNQSSFIYILL